MAIYPCAVTRTEVIYIKSIIIYALSWIKLAQGIVEWEAPVNVVISKHEASVKSASLHLLKSYRLILYLSTQLVAQAF